MNPTLKDYLSWWALFHRGPFEDEFPGATVHVGGFYLTNEPANDPDGLWYAVGVYTISDELGCWTIQRRSHFPVPDDTFEAAAAAFIQHYRETYPIPPAIPAQIFNAEEQPDMPTEQTDIIAQRDGLIAEKLGMGGEE